MDEKDLEFLELNRRFGLEIEVNSADGNSRPPRGSELPDGIHYIGHLISKAIGENVKIAKWDYYHNNNDWVLKKDTSCGIEICTPVLKGICGLDTIRTVVHALSEDPCVQADDRCSLHVHVEVSDLSNAEVASVLAWWIKCEAVFLDAMPSLRKRSRYCQFIGITDLFDLNSEINSDLIIKKLGQSKYTTVNVYHLRKNRRRTIEFRIAENCMCLNEDDAVNWTSLILHFVNKTAKRGIPVKYSKGNKWSSLLWLDPKDIFEILDFYPNNFLTSRLKLVRNWFIMRLLKNLPNTGLTGIWQDKIRSVSYKEVCELATFYNLLDLCETSSDINI